MLDKAFRLCRIRILFAAGVAQLVERNLAKVEVASSRLVSRSTKLLQITNIGFGRCVLSDAGVAQLVERNLAKVEVASSRLVSRSNFFFPLCKFRVSVVRTSFRARRFP